MARTLISAVVVDRTGTINNPALAALDAVNFNNFNNNGRILLEANNTAGVSGTVTILLPSTSLPDTQPGANVAFTNAGVQYTLAAAADILLGPFPPAIYNQSDGTVWLNGSAATMKYRLIQLN